MNSAYLSELWAVKDLRRIKTDFPEHWTEEKEGQLQDEIRHVSLIHEALRAQGSPIVTDIKFSMQDRLYRRFIDLGGTSSVTESSCVHDMTERRAVWIYRTYLRVGRNEAYKKLAQQILEDEKGHFHVNSITPEPRSRFVDSVVKSIDRFIFRQWLPAEYGAVLFASSAFWDFYYDGASAN